MQHTTATPNKMTQTRDKNPIVIIAIAHCGRMFSSSSSVGGGATFLITEIKLYKI